MVGSMQNWVEDLYFKELDLNYPGVTDAMVSWNDILESF
jgi:hypothetical protein